MLIAESNVATGRSSRYLVQLCQHIKLIAQRHPQLQAQVEWTDDRGEISFGRGRCTLRADPGVLVLRIEAPDDATLRQLEQRIAGRLEQVGRRDRLTVTWTSPRDIAEQAPSARPSHRAGQGHDHD
ncbi:MAG TPA: DUF2218 domain-containing protein [Actinomycetes bacterium]|nr:DUF2218 domain-containing protein [Actinomycetes bacterium]